MKVLEFSAYVRTTRETAVRSCSIFKVCLVRVRLYCTVCSVRSLT